MTAPLPIVWTIAGSDSGGGAGIQADLKTFHGLGVHGCSVITAITAQSTVGIRDLEMVSPRMIRAQCDALAADLPPAAVKIGMLGCAETIRIVARHVRELAVPVVCDPILASTSGTKLLEDTGLRVLREELLPAVDLLTPNVPEAAALLGHPVQGAAEVEAAARELLALGSRAVLITGGHLEGPSCQDYFTNGRQSFWMTSPRQQAAGTHGTGCVLSSAIAAARARGWDWPDAAVLAKAYLNQGLRQSSAVGSGNSPVFCGTMPADPEDMPWVTDTAEAGRRGLRFPPPDPIPHGLFPVLASLDAVRRLLPLGLPFLQLRINNQTSPQPDQDIAEAIGLARNSTTRLFIHQHGQTILQYGAHGIHLEQEDLDSDALPALADAGVRVGITAHSPFAIARALPCQPSYIAVGPLYADASQATPESPIGLETFAQLRRLIPCPTIAFGGIEPHHARPLHNAGADGISVNLEPGDVPRWQDAWSSAEGGREGGEEW